MDVKRER